jgi:hypothetical protein
MQKKFSNKNSLLDLVIVRAKPIMTVSAFEHFGPIVLGLCPPKFWLKDMNEIKMDLRVGVFFLNFEHRSGSRAKLSDN